MLPDALVERFTCKISYCCCLERPLTLLELEDRDVMFQALSKDGR